MNFTIRSTRSELLDQPDIPASDIWRNLYELAIINSRLGGHAITWQGYIHLAKKGEKNHICEIGCGGGDNLKYIEEKNSFEYAALTITGIDINPDCIQIAENLKWKSPVQFRVSDFKKVVFPVKPDIIFSSLFCHHFKEDALIEMFQWMRDNSRYGFFINDLHRHWLAYYLIRMLTRLFSKSYLVKNDAPLSVLRGFKKKEFKSLMKKAGISNYTIQWKWAFRWLIIVQS